MDLTSFINEPKAELHVHLEGSFRPERAIELASKKNAHPWSGLNQDSLRKRLQANNFQEFINHFMDGYRLLKTAADFQAVTEDLCQSFEEQGVCYAEVLYSPGVYIQKMGRSLKDIHDGIEAGLAQYPRIKVRFVLDTVLNMGVDFMNATLTAVLADPRPFVRGFSVGGGLPELDMRGMLPLFYKAQENGLFIVAHAGEVDGPENIRILVEETDIRRIAHGCAAAESPEVMALLKRRGVGIDVSLTSNIWTGVVADLEKHPIRTFVREGLSLTLNTDDPFYFETDLYREYLLAQGLVGFSDEELKALMHNGLRAAD